MKKFYASALLLLLAPVALGAPSDRSTPTAGSLIGPDFDARVLHANDHELQARGSNFAAILDDEGACFEPLLPRDAEPGGTVRLTLEAVGRGSELAPVATPTLRADGLVAVLQRGPALAERYEVRQDGLYQSFVLAERPAGAGDLVLQLAVTTELEPGPGDGADVALTFGRAGEALARYGQVVAVSADGRRAPGRVFLEDGALRLVVPAEFVDSATYPLVVDPFVGSTTPLGSLGDNLFDPEISYDANSGVYMLVCRFQAATYSDIDGYRFDGNLQPIGGVMQVDWNTNESSRRPAVGNVNSTDRFLVTWENGNNGGTPDLVYRTYEPSTGIGSSPTTFSIPGQAVVRPVIGGQRDFSAAVDRAWIVYERGSGGIYPLAVNVPLGGPPLLAALLNPVSTIGEKPAISRGVSNTDRHVLAWLEDVGSHTRLRCTTLLHGSSVTSSLQFVGPSSPVSATEVAVDGDGTDFLLVWKEQYLGANHAIRATCLHWNGTFLEEPFPTLTLASSSFNSTLADPKVAFVGSRYLVSYSTQSGFSGTKDLVLVGLEPSTCTVCSTSQFVGGSPGTRNDPAIVSEWSGGGIFSSGLLVWDQDDGNGTRGIHGIEVGGIQGGTIVDHGGGCGGGGTLYSDLPFLGNADYQLAIFGADNSATAAILNLRQVPTLFTCNTCTTSVTVGSLEVMPLSSGSGSLAIPLPCDPSLFGYTTHIQAIAVLPTLSTPCPFFGNISASNRLEITIGQ